MNGAAATETASDMGKISPAVKRNMDVLGTEFAGICQYYGLDIPLNGSNLLLEREQLSCVPHARAPQETLRGGGFLAKASDGWLALNLPRVTDWELIPALTEGELHEADRFSLEQWLSTVSCAQVTGLSGILGLAIGKVPDEERSAAPLGGTPRIPPRQISGLHRSGSSHISDLKVVDLSRLWAGPLAGALLARVGAQVLKVEDESQIEVPLPSDAEFFERLNGSKERVTLDFSDNRSLNAVVSSADIVILSCRDRATNALGLKPREGQIWASISAHGIEADGSQRIGFGDDCAAEAGAVTWTQAKPDFMGDALADPITGLLTAVSILALSTQQFAGQLRFELANSVRWALQPQRSMSEWPN